MALKPLDDKLCEVKRLYVREKFRHSGIGKLLMNKIIEDAKKLNYSTMVLETFDSLEAAVHIYYKLGFEKKEKDCEDLKKGIIYMTLDLNK